MEKKSDADIMAEAREYIERNGWWRGGLRGPNGRQVCALGGLVYSQGWGNKSGNGYNTEYMEDVERILGKLHAVLSIPGSDGWVFTSWNDKIAKDKQEVLDVFAKAEKIERAGFDPDAP
jgi:hypothetical protein